MKTEEAKKYLDEMVDLTKEEIKEKFGLEVARNSCARFRDMNKVEPETAKKAFDVYMKIKSKEGGLNILKNLAEKAGIAYVAPEVAPKPVKEAKKTETVKEKTVTIEGKEAEKKAEEPAAKEPEKKKAEELAADKTDKKAPEKKPGLGTAKKKFTPKKTPATAATNG